jgi:hypothetical protein
MQPYAVLPMIAYGCIKINREFNQPYGFFIVNPDPLTNSWDSGMGESKREMITSGSFRDSDRAYRTSLILMLYFSWLNKNL